jgi:hypothetical protein
MSNIVALLDSMWRWGGYKDAGEVAPAYFRINPNNHSGRRLYRLCGQHSLLVTNCCRIVQPTANHHGKPDVEQVRSNLTLLAEEKMHLLLLCGRIAQATFQELGSTILGTEGTCYLSGAGIIRYLCMDHPAARRWTKEMIEQKARSIERLCRDSN